MSLFGDITPDPWEEPAADAPLAERLRPRELEEILGQEEILGPDRWLLQAIRSDRIPSLILWGPPGTGKTTLARVIARTTRAVFVPYSAVVSGIKEVKGIMAAARERRRASGGRTILFVDEIHRFNKAQQDAFLPHVERGDIVLIGATTENPSFEVNGALLSRARVLVLKPLTEGDLVTLQERALTLPERGLGELGVTAERAVLEGIARYASGDARRALGLLEEAANLVHRQGESTITLAHMEEAVGARALLYDKSGEEHYNLISALHKSLRSSDPQAALYWFERMLAAGEDPMYVARRLVRFAVEDVGLGDPAALRITLAAREAYHFLGLPEGKLALAQAVVYLALAPRTDRVYRALGAVEKEVRKGWADPVPLHIRNAPTKLMKDLKYGKGYQHAHESEDGLVDMECLPERLAGRRFYEPSDQGLERRLGERLAEAEAKRRRGDGGSGH